MPKLSTRSSQPTAKRRIAVSFLIIWTAHMLLPVAAMALTSGPAQPEVQSFQPAGVTDMVDLQTGDFKYNIPLLDVDGYPLNLSYQSGTGMDDEASWVGTGWTLNTGSVNRQVRGVADDMKGDLSEVQHHTKPMITIGGRISGKVETFGFAALTGSGTVTYGGYVNNYTGIGVEIAANAGISLSRGSGGMMTSALGFGITSDSQKGVDVSPYASLSLADNASGNIVNQAGLSASLGYNTRSGLKSLSLGSSFGGSIGKFSYQTANLSELGLGISYNTEPISPKTQIPYYSSSTSFSLDLGISAGIFVGAGFTGYRTEKRVLNEKQTNPTYGFLYAEKGKNVSSAIMDFVREKENPVIPELPNVALPVQMPDLFAYNSQGGSGQFRLYRGGTGTFFDNQADDESHSETFGADFGYSPFGAHTGVTFFKQTLNNTTRKWTKDNDYLKNGDFQDELQTDVNKQHVYFKTLGELGKQDNILAAQINYTNAVKPELADKRATGNFYGTAVTAPLVKNKRETAKTMVSYLTAEQADKAGLDNAINVFANYDFGSLPAQLPNKPLPVTKYPRVDPAIDGVPAPSPALYPVLNDAQRDVNEYPVHKAHHISEITVTEGGGKRMVYGVPVYNVKQDEYSFAIGKSGTNYSLINQNQVNPQLGSGTPGAGLGIDNYYHRESKAPFATSYLLSAVLSPDYVDRTNNGVTDDDLGTAIKFNYSKLPYLYKWRTPYANATVNQGLPADPDDDKASIIYGEKEIYYTSSIESKTKIAYFITKDRDDGLGVNGWAQGAKDISNKQKCLMEIRLYSKADMTRPIKVVKFNYNYALCPGVPNNVTAGAGKLTLTKVWFEYGNIDKGKNNAYQFSYNTTVSGSTVGYGNMLTDRWGTYKTQGENLDPTLNNEEYPYTGQQSRATADADAALWQLTTIQLPTGGQIDVKYEADDYGYVQNRKAMSMYKIAAFTDAAGAALTGATDDRLIRAKGIKIAIPVTYMPVGVAAADQTQWFKSHFLNGSDYLYTKMDVTIATDGNAHPDDLISCYAEVQSVAFSSADNTAVVTFKPIDDGGVAGANPMIIAAWQKMKNEYPRYAYPGYDNRKSADAAGTISGLVSATINAVGNLKELTTPFYKRAQGKKLAGTVNLNKSFVRLTKYDGAKLGGGARVKKIYIADNWSGMSGSGNSTFNAFYGQQYDYINEDGSSSGVAAYEPSVGNDENPFKQPVIYTQKIKGAINNYLDLEEPFGESLFPSPTVTYGRVRVSNLDKSQNVDATYRTGYIVNEFYTSKDFPVKVIALPITTIHKPASTTFSFIKTTSDDELFMSQGYCVQLNDMNGKPKAVRVYNQGKSMISATEYFYKSTDTGGGQYTLDNHVKVVNPDGTVTDEIMGQDIEMFTDFREQESINRGNTVNIGADLLLALFFPVFLPHFPINANDDYRLYRSGCALKVVQSYGILDKVVKTENGSSITTQNIAFDGVTGDALVTKTQNEFNNDIYNVNIPAYWAYSGMGPSSKNLGLMLSDLTTDATGTLTAKYAANLDLGDELVDLSTDLNHNINGKHYWVTSQTVPISGGAPTYDPVTGALIPPPLGGVYNRKVLLDQNGNLGKSLSPSLVKIVRAGARNMLNDGISKIVCLSNPISADNKFKLASLQDLTALKVINASASTFDENWSVEQPEYQANENTAYTWDLNEGASLDLHYGGDRYIADNMVAYNNFADGYSAGQGNGYGTYFRSEMERFAVTPPMHPLGSYTQDILSVYDTFNVPETKDYYMGIGGNIGIEVRLDNDICNTPPAFIDGNSAFVAFPRDHFEWRLNKIHLTAGAHKIRFDFHNWDLPPSVPGTLNRAAAMVIYNNTLAELSPSPTPPYNDLPANVTRLYSTIDLWQRAGLKMALKTDGGLNIARYADGSGQDPNSCLPPAINPYLFGFKGNWRPFKSKVYQQGRAYNDLLNTKSKGVDVKNAGYIKSFYPNWYFNGTNNAWVQNESTTASRWITANTVTQYDRYGQQLENMDALFRFSAAKFDFNGELPSAVASNASNREIYSMTFEDGQFQPGTITNALIYTREFMTGPNTTAQMAADKSSSHSGNYSLSLGAGGITMQTVLNNQTPKFDEYLQLDENYRFVKSPALGLYPKGFEPVPGRQYLFNAWIKDAQPTDKTTANLKLTVNGTVYALKCKAIVEGWKLVEGLFTVPNTAAGSSLLLTIAPASGSGVRIDDIRIHPNESQMKTYAYDDRTMRLMAEMDENAMATFYEYDDQGLLIRVKKETEKGIMTLKETRSSYKKGL